MRPRRYRRPTHRAVRPAPRLSARRAARHRRRARPLVKTHCCFCGQQCGIQLKVKDNEVIGFEPWDDFPFNQGMLCPKGVKRYLQGSHPDRLLTRYERDPSAPGGFRAIALRRGDPPRRRGDRAHPVDARPRRLRRAQRREPDHREDLPDGQVRPRVPEDARTSTTTAGSAWSAPAPATRRRSASTAPPTPGPTSSAPRSSGSAARTSPSARRSPPTTSGRRASTARRSSSSIRASRRSRAPATCSCRSSPGRDVALFNGILHLMIEHDWLDHEFIEQHTVGFEAVAEHVKRVDAATTAEVTGIAEKAIRQAAEMVGHGEDQLPAARPRHRAPQPRRAERAGRDQHRAGLGPHRPRGLRLRHDHRPGQRPGRPRARPEVRPASRRARHRQPRAPRLRRRRLGHRRRTSCRSRASTPTRSSARSTAARSRGCCRSASTRSSRCPTTTSSRAMLEKLEFYVAIDFFLNETAPLRRHRAARLAARGGRGHGHADRGPGDQDQQGGRPARATRGRTGGSSRTSPRALGREHGFTFDEPREIFDELRVASQGRRRRLLRHHLREDRAAVRRLLALPDARTIPARRGCSSRARGTRRARAQGRSTSPTARRASTSPPTRRRRRRRRGVSGHPDHRPGGQPVPLGHADAPHRPAGRSVPRAARRDSSAAGRAARHRRRRLGDGRDAARQLHAAGAGGRRPSGPTRSSFRTTGPGRRASTS